MQKKLIISLFFIYSSLLFSKEIIFKTDVWCPYACEPKSDHPGYVIEMLKEIYSAHGFKVKYEVLSWSRAKEEVKSGLIDGVIGGGKKEFSSFLIPDETIGVNSNFFWTDKNNTFNFSNINDLGKFKSDSIGIINDYNYGEILLPLITKKSPVFHVVAGDNALDTLLTMLKNSRLTALIEDENVFKYKVRLLKYNLLDFKKCSANLNLDNGLYIGFTSKKKSSKQLIKIFNEGIIKLRNSGKLNIILQKYGLKDWK